MTLVENLVVTWFRFALKHPIGNLSPYFCLDKYYLINFFNRVKISSLICGLEDVE